MTRATYFATSLLRSLVHRPQGVILVYVFYITVPFHGMNSVWNHTISTAVDVYWWLSALTEYLYFPACWIILPHPWGKLIKSQLLGKDHFKGFCENCVLLILPWICSQNIKDSESKLIVQSSWFLLHEAKKKVAHFTPLYPIYRGRWGRMG